MPENAKFRISSPLFRIPLSFPQRPLPQPLMHPLTDTHDPPIIHPTNRTNPPLHQRMRPPRRARPSPPLCPTRPANTPQCISHKSLGAGNHETRLPNLTHRARHQITLHQLHMHAAPLEFRTQRGGPLLQERFAAAIRRQQRRGHQPAERTHGEDQAATLRNHFRGDERSHEEGAVAVDVDDVPHLPVLRLHERDGDIVALAHVVDQHRHILQLRDGVLQSVDAGVGGGAEIVSESFDLDLGVLGADLRGESIEL